MIAAIDAGSNTLRLLVGEVDKGKVIPGSYHRRITRLAGGYTKETGLSQEAQQRTLTAFQEFSSICNKSDINDIRAVGTAAFRQAANGHDFSHLVKSATGIDLKVIDGEQEAAFMASGVLSALEPRPRHSLIIDIGGGSTEFVLCKGQDVLWSKSLALGVVRLTEAFASPEQMLAAIDSSVRELSLGLSRACRNADVSPSTLSLVGTAGTVTTLAALDMQMAEYDWKKVNNYTLSVSRLRHWQTVLEPLEVAQREALPGMETGRGDLIMPGIEIILCLMKQLNLDSLSVSDFGILEGLLLLPDEFGKT